MPHDVPELLGKSLSAIFGPESLMPSAPITRALEITDLCWRLPKPHPHRRVVACTLLSCGTLTVLEAECAGPWSEWISVGDHHGVFAVWSFSRDDLAALPTALSGEPHAVFREHVETFWGADLAEFLLVLDASFPSAAPS